MKKSGVCPKCRHASVHHVRAVAQLDHDTFRKTIPFALEVQGVTAKDGHTYPTGLGETEAYVCKGCGFVEWYVKDPASLARP